MEVRATVDAARVSLTAVRIIIVVADCLEKIALFVKRNIQNLNRNERRGFRLRLSQPKKKKILVPSIFHYLTINYEHILVI